MRRNSSFVDTEYNSVPRVCEITTSRDVESVVHVQRSNQTESEFVPIINIISLGEQRWPSLLLSIIHDFGASDYYEQFGQLGSPLLSIIRAVVSSYRGASWSDVTKLSDWEFGAYLPIFCVEAVSPGATFVA